MPRFPEAHTYTANVRKKAITSLLEWYATATDHERELGRQWYRRAFHICETLAERHKLPVERVVFALAALSPRVPWDRNVEMLIELLRHKHTNGLRPSVVAAARCLRGDLDALSGPKVRAFAAAILGEQESVVLDTWMLLAAKHWRENVSFAQYEAIAQCLAEAARAVDETPSTFQAIVWLAIRERGPIGGDSEVPFHE